MKRRLPRVGLVLLLFALGVAVARFGSPARVVVTWETASEVDTAGFLVYRTASPAGPYTLLTQTPVPAQGDPLVGASYRYEDRDVAWGRRYSYQLAEVQRDGTEDRFDRTASARAGVGWAWAVAAGALLAAAGAAALRYLDRLRPGAVARQQ